MSVAVLIQTEGVSLDGKIRQTLVVPTDTASVLFSRTTDGSKGKANAWGEVDEVRFGTDEYLTHEPVGVVLSIGDSEALQRGNVSILAQKALTALSKVEASAAGDHASPEDVLERVEGLVSSQDPEVADFVKDGRRVNPLTITRRIAPVPAVSNTPAAPAAAGAAPVLAPAGAGFALRVADPAFAKKYVNRKVRGTQDFVTLDVAMEKGWNVSILGPTGSGKTTVAVAYASARGLPYFRVPGNQALEPSEMYGSWVPDGTGGWVWMDGPITAIVRHGGVLILDEANLISPKVLTDLYPLLDFGREVTLKNHGNEVIKAEIGKVLIVVTGNPNYVGTGIFSEAFKDRFAVRFQDWGYDAQVEKKLVKSASLRKMGGDLRNKGDIETPVSTRLLTEFEDVVSALGWDFAVDNLLDRFDDSEEREAVRGVVNTWKDNIQIDLGLKEKPVVVETPEASTEGLADWEKDLLNAPWDTK